MPLPNDVLDFIAKLGIVGVPTQINPGVAIKPKLSPSLDILTSAVEEVLANIRLPLPPLRFSLNLDQIHLRPAELDPADNISDKTGQTDFQVLLKAVEMPQEDLTAADVDPVSEVATRKLPYIIPTGTTLPPVMGIGTAVQGLLGRVKGKIEPFEQLTGSVGGSLGSVTDPQNLAGTIFGTLTRAVPGRDLEVTVTWRIQDANLQDLTPGEHFVLLENSILSRKKEANVPTQLLPPVFAFLPELTELGSLDVTARRWISCEIKVKKGADEPTHVVGPVPIDVPKLQVPTVLAMTEHTVDAVSSTFPGAVLITVPRSSPIEGLTGLNEPIRTVVSLLETIRDTPNVLDAVLLSRYAGTISELKRLLDKLLTAGNVRFLKLDQIYDLAGVTLDPGAAFGFGYRSWEDHTSAILLVGPPGRAARFHNRKNLWIGTGAFTLTVGPAAVAFAGVLRGSNPGVGPEGSTLEVTHPANNFNDVISSYRFVLS